MTLNPSPSSRHPVLRCALVGLLALLVLGGGVELHHHHGLAELGFWGEASGRCHPELSTHLEPPKPDEPRECLGCLLRLRPREGVVEAQSLGPLALVTFLVSSERPELQPLITLAPPASRGPPPTFA